MWLSWRSQDSDLNWFLNFWILFIFKDTFQFLLDKIQKVHNFSYTLNYAYIHNLYLRYLELFAVLVDTFSTRRDSAGQCYLWVIFHLSLPVSADSLPLNTFFNPVLQSGYLLIFLDHLFLPINITLLPQPLKKAKIYRICPH